MPSPHFLRQLYTAFRMWWCEQRRRKGALTASRVLIQALWGFLRDSTPERRRGRYGDMEYDWEHRVNTTSGTVGWRERLLGVFHSPYQPTDPASFQQMMASLPIDFPEFTFVDLGSGKGRTLLMASDYPFRRIIGVEILSKLHRAAEENVHAYKNSKQRCANIEPVCADARDFVLPPDPLVLYLFNPLPVEGLETFLRNLEMSLLQRPRVIYLLYHNPVLDLHLRTCPWLEVVGGTNEFAVYRAQQVS